MKDSFYSVEPHSELIRKYISHYYFHKSDDSEPKISFSYYPHYKNALTIYRNSKVEIIAGTHTKSSPHKDGYSYTYTQLYKNFGHAEILGPFDKIGIVFQPLGLNHFVPRNLSALASDEVNLNFSHFQRSLPTVLDIVFDQKYIDVKVELLDAHFLQYLVEFEDKRLPAVVDFIFRTEDKLSVKQISENFDINRKTLLRLFNRHLNCSPKEYITLVQFRRAVELYQNSTHKPSLTRLALDLDYYDQSDFIHRFTKITGVSPKRLFTNIEKYGVHATYWTKD